MLTECTMKKSVALLGAILAVGFLIVSVNAYAVDFEPFGINLVYTQSEPNDISNKGPVIPKIEFNNSDISMAFQIISDATGWSIFPTAEVSKAKISLWAKDITAKEMLDRVVATTGFVYHKQNDVIMVMTYDEYMQHYSLEKEVISFKYADAGSIATVVKPFLTKLGRIIVHKETNTIILLESHANLQTIIKVIEKLDIPADTKIVIEVITLKYADAEALAESVQKVFSNKENKTDQEYVLTEESSRNVKKQPVSSKTVKDEVSPSAQVEVGIYPIGCTNQLIVKASQDNIEKIKKLVEKLDTFVEPTTRNYHFTYIEASEIFEGLQRILNVSDKSGGTSRSGSISRNEREYDRYDGAVLVEKTNSILLTGQPSLHRIMASMVETMDVPTVYEEGMIKVYKLENADVDEVADVVRDLLQYENNQQEKSNDAKFTKRFSDSSSKVLTKNIDRGLKITSQAGLGQTEEFIPQVESRVSVSKSTNSVVVQATTRQHAELEKLIKELDKRRKQVMIDAMIVDVTTDDNSNLGVELGHAGEDGAVFTSYGLSTGLNPITGKRDITVSPGGTAAILSRDKVQVIIQALKSEKNVKVKSVPQILVNDNAVGFIDSIAEEPITQVNASNTVATTSFAGFVEAGTQFSITPHISENDYLRVEYQITLNSFGAKSTDPSIPPSRNTSSIKSEATVPNGSTIVVGGLQAANNNEGIDKVPLLGDIPVIGLMFKNTTVKNQRKTTYLFITPVIMDQKNFGDLRDASREALGEIEGSDKSKQINNTKKN